MCVINGVHDRTGQGLPGVMNSGLFRWRILRESESSQHCSNRSQGQGYPDPREPTPLTESSYQGVPATTHVITHGGRN